MKQNSLIALLVGFLALSVSTDASAASPSRLITPRDAARHGLKRAWYTQVPIDPGRSRVSHLRLFERNGQVPDTLFVQTDRAVVHAVDAETGQTLWMRVVGSETHPTMAVGANDKLVGVVNGTKLYLLDRSNGRILWTRTTEGIPADGPVLTSHYAFVPMISGKVVAYAIEKKRVEEEEDPLLKPKASADGKPEQGPTSLPKPKPQDSDAEEGPIELEDQLLAPLTCVSFGRVTSQPVFTHEDLKNQYVAWSTTKGLFVGNVDLRSQDEFAVKYQLRTRSQIVTQPTYLPPNGGTGRREGLIFVTSEMGEVYAISATRGTETWQYAIGQPIVEPVIPIGQRVYVATELDNFFCLEAITGNEHWSTRGVSQFIAAGKNKIYTADPSGQIRVLDAQSGRHIDTIAAADLPLKFRNLHTDRIYLATPTGLIQCLHEIDQSEPLRYRKAPAPHVEATPGKEPNPAEEPAEPEENPFAPPDESGPNPFLETT